MRHICLFFRHTLLPNITDPLFCSSHKATGEIEPRNLIREDKMNPSPHFNPAPCNVIFTYEDLKKKESQIK